MGRMCYVPYHTVHLHLQRGESKKKIHLSSVNIVYIYIYPGLLETPLQEGVWSCFCTVNEPRPSHGPSGSPFGLARPVDPPADEESGSKPQG